jgi:hypothetical protein
MHISLFYRLFHFFYLQNHVRDVAFAIRGVPLLLPAISIAASIDIGILSIDALLSTIVVNSSAV